MGTWNLELLPLVRAWVVYMKFLPFVGAWIMCVYEISALGWGLNYVYIWKFCTWLGLELCITILSLEVGSYLRGEHCLGSGPWQFKCPKRFMISFPPKYTACSPFGPIPRMGPNGARQWRDSQCVDSQSDTTRLAKWVNECALVDEETNWNCHSQYSWVLLRILQYCLFHSCKYQSAVGHVCCSCETVGVTVS